MKYRIACLGALLLWIAAAPAAQEPDEFYRAGPGVTLPVVMREVRPNYPSDAMRDQVTGRVAVECIVELDGVPSHIRVARPLHPSLDAEAVKAMAQWRFRPGMKDGKPARVQITVEMTFSMAPSSGPPQNVVILSRTSADGVRTVWDVARERFDRQPSWRSDAGTPPPLSVADALQAANDWVQKREPRTYPTLMQSASLQRLSGLQWYYRVEYALQSATPASASERVTVVVLLDGTVVEPRTER
jgi:TonB family protein